MEVTPRELNWSGTVSYTAERVEQPLTIEHAQELVATNLRVHGLGTRHSFNDVADTSGVLIDMTQVPTDLDVDARGRTVTFGAGSRYGHIAPEIDAAGLALQNMGSLPHISVGGAIATSTHGSGTRVQSLSAMVSALEYIDASGELCRVHRGDPDFDGMVIHLGLLGILTRVTLETEPTFSMRQDTFAAMPWQTFLESLDHVFAAGYSVCCFTNWDGQVREILVKTRVPDGASDVDVPEVLFGSQRLPPSAHNAHVTDRDGSVGPWWDRLPHFPITSTPSVGSEVQSEHFVPLRHAAAALEAVARLASRIQPHLHVTELRTMAADGLWLSPSQGEDVLCIAFTWKRHPEDVRALLPDLEAALEPFDGRPHWGKMSSLGPTRIGELYPRAASFRSLVERADPGGKFSSAFGERIFNLRRSGRKQADRRAQSAVVERLQTAAVSHPDVTPTRTE
jgi:xylitol oxidase